MYKILSQIRTKGVIALAGALALFIVSEDSEYVFQAILQIVAVSGLLCWFAPQLKKNFELPLDDWQSCVLGGVAVAFIIALSKTFWMLISTPIPGNELFVGDTAAIGTSATTHLKINDCDNPPSLSECVVGDQSVECVTSPGQDCQADPQSQPFSDELDDIDRWLRQTSESIRKTEQYLNISRPDERWINKEEMDNPENMNLYKNFKL